MRLIILSMVLFPSLLVGQKLKSDSSYVHFFSDAPMEDIEAVNNDGVSVVDLDNGNLVFSIPIKGFVFDKSLMQEHFNENYLESDKYPKATFSGSVQDWNATLSGSYEATAKGELTIHGVKKEVEVTGQVKRADQGMTISAVFPIRLEDFKIKIPKAVFYNIAEEVEVTIYFEYQPL